MQDVSFIPHFVNDRSIQQTLSVPAGIFCNRTLGALETTTKFLKENEGMRFCEIAKALNRDESTIWDAYRASTTKMPEKIETFSELHIPLEVIANRKLSTLESITVYLKEVVGMKYCKIALLIGKDDRTVWTVYQRSRKKRAQC